MADSYEEMQVAQRKRQRELATWHAEQDRYNRAQLAELDAQNVKGEPLTAVSLNEPIGDNDNDRAVVIPIVEVKLEEPKAPKQKKAPSTN